MSRYVDVDGYRKLFDEEYKKTRELIRQGETHLDNLAEGFSEASRVIDSIPTADVVPFVRCKDCKYYCANYCTRDIKGRTNMFYMTADDFCSYGERKES